MATNRCTINTIYKYHAHIDVQDQEKTKSFISTMFLASNGLLVLSVARCTILSIQNPDSQGTVRSSCTCD